MAKQRHQQRMMQLHWPTAGLDRSGPYRESGPFTTPDAVNVRVWGQRQYRERGGSRPGLEKALTTDLGAPIRILTKVPILLSNSPGQIDVYRGRSLRAFSGLKYQEQFSNQYLTGDGAGSVTGQVGTTGDIELSIDVRPGESGVYDGRVRFQFWMDGQNNPTQEGFSVALRLTNNTYDATASHAVGGVISVVNNAISGVFNDNPNAAGTFVVKRSGATLKAWFRGVEIFSGTYSTAAAGSNFGFELIQTTADSIEVTGFTHEFAFNDANQVDRSLRRDLLIAIAGGQLWSESTSNELEQISGHTFRDVQLCATSREQKLYIADYGEVAAGSGTAAITSQITGFDFLGGGVTSDHLLVITGSDNAVNEVQSVSIGTAANVVGSTFTLTFNGRTTTSLLHITSAPQLQQALGAIGVTSTVTGTAGGPWQIEFTGTWGGRDLDPIAIDSTNLQDAGANPVEGSVTTQTNGSGADIFNGIYQVSNITNNSIDISPPLPSTGANVNFRIGKPPRIYDAQTRTITAHSAEKGSIPVGSRLVALYRDRIVYAGAADAPHVWWMSRQGDPNDFDWTQDDAGAAVFAQNSPAGQIADPITAIVNHSDECLVFGCYNSLWILRGDPGFGGTIDQLSIKIGIIGCDAWCKTPDDMMVFMSADGLYTIPAGCHGQVTSLSRERLPDDLLCLDENQEHVCLEYDVVNRGIHIYVTRHNGQSSDHWWYDWVNQSFWRVTLDVNHEPFSCHERISWDDCAEVLLGCRDGKIRRYNRDLVKDDGIEFESYCLIGPFGMGHGHDFDVGVMKEIQAVLGAGSGPINWSVHVGNTFEQAVTASSVRNGTWTAATLNYVDRPQARGHAAVVRVEGDKQSHWFLESIQAIVRIAGKRRVY